MKRAYLLGGLAAVAAALSIVLLVVKAGHPPASSKGAGPTPGLTPQEWPTYYLSRDSEATILVDFIGQQSAFDRLDSGSRSLHFAQEMIREFRRNGDTKAKDATTVHLVAVYIHGKDNYGRPDFSRRTNLLKLTGPRDVFLTLTDADLENWDRLKQRFAKEAE